MYLYSNSPSCLIFSLISINQSLWVKTPPEKVRRITPQKSYHKHVPLKKVTLDPQGFPIPPWEYLNLWMSSLNYSAVIHHSYGKYGPRPHGAFRFFHGDFPLLYYIVYQRVISTNICHLLLDSYWSQLMAIVLNWWDDLSLISSNIEKLFVANVKCSNHAWLISESFIPWYKSSIYPLKMHI